MPRCIEVVHEGRWQASDRISLVGDRVSARAMARARAHEPLPSSSTLHTAVGVEQCKTEHKEAPSTMKNQGSKESLVLEPHVKLEVSLSASLPVL
jgi:hypothetical protein